MPRLWNATVDAHRRDVRTAILDATWSLVTERGLTAVKMAHVAERTGIGRATLYKYFPDVDAILLAWHQEHVEQHLDELAQMRDRSGSPSDRLRAALTRYAAIVRRRGLQAAELMTFLHRDSQVTAPEQHIATLITDLLTQAAAAGEVRDDVQPSELAHYCLHALNAAGSLPSQVAADRLVAVVLSGLRPPA